MTRLAVLLAVVALVVGVESKGYELSLVGLPESDFPKIFGYLKKLPTLDHIQPTHLLFASRTGTTEHPEHYFVAFSGVDKNNIWLIERLSVDGDRVTSTKPAKMGKIPEIPTGPMTTLLRLMRYADEVNKAAFSMLKAGEIAGLRRLLPKYFDILQEVGKLKSKQY